MSKYMVGSGTKAIGKLALATHNSTIDLTSESLSETYNYQSPESLLASKTVSSRDLQNITIEGSISALMRPESIDWMLEASLGKKGDFEPSEGLVEAHPGFMLAEVNADLPKSEIDIMRGTVGKVYKGLVARSVTMNFPAQEYATIDIDFVGNEAVTDTAHVSAPNFTKPAFRVNHSKLVFAARDSLKNVDEQEQEMLLKCLADACGEGYFDAENFSVSIDNGVESAPATFCTGLFAGDAIMGKRSVTCDFTLPYSSDVENFRKQFYAVNEGAPDFMLAFVCRNGNEALSVFIPSAHVTSIPVNVGGEGLIETTISIEALDKIGEEPILIRHMKLVSSGSASSGSTS